MWTISQSIGQVGGGGSRASVSGSWLCLGSDLLTLEWQISSGRLNRRPSSQLINDLPCLEPQMEPRWSGVPTPIYGWSCRNLKNKFGGFFLANEAGVKKKHRDDKERGGGIPQVAPLLERDRQVDRQQSHREFLEGSSRSSQLRKRQYKIVPEGARQKLSTDVFFLPLRLLDIIAGFLVLPQTLGIPSNQITVNVNLSSTKVIPGFAQEKTWLKMDSFLLAWLPTGILNDCKWRVSADEW